VGQDLECNDMNLCSIDSCDSMIGCVFDVQEGCCQSDEDCPDGEICLLGSNSCIPDPDPDGDSTDTTDTDTGDTTETTDEGDTTESTTDEGDSTTDEGESGSGSESGEDSGTGTDSADEIGDEASTFDTFGAPEAEDGCGCTSEPGSGSKALFGLLGLALLGAVRRRRA
jgi:MYXO-CTERM domain-containing protein